MSGEQGSAASSAASWAAWEAAWEAAWPGRRPIAHELRDDERWVRFHSLPGSKRCPGSREEYAEVLRRHRAVLGELAGTPTGSGRALVVVTCSWSGGPGPAARDAPLAAALPDARYWRSTVAPDDDEEWTHLFVNRLDLDDPRLDRLLVLVADGETAGVLVTDATVSWTYHPYDGGADVYPPTVARRDELRERYHAWRSAHPSGL